MRVDEDHHDGQHVHVWVPAAIVPMAMHVIPSRHFRPAAANIGPWLPMLRALTKELKRYPETELVEVEDSRQHVHIRTHQGKLLIDVTNPGEDVHIACPLAMLEDVANQLEAKAPGV
jgi:NAD(P)H-flavin reductase